MGRVPDLERPGARRLRLAQMPGGRRRCPGLRGWTPLDSTGELLDDLGRRAGEQRRADRDRYGRLPTATCCRRQTECLRRARLELTLSAQAHPQAPGDLLLALAATGTVAGAPREDLLSLRLQRRHARAEHADDASQVLVPSVRRGVLLGRLQDPSPETARARSARDTLALSADGVARAADPDDPATEGDPEVKPEGSPPATRDAASVEAPAAPAGVGVPVWLARLRTETQLGRDRGSRAR